MQRIMTRRNGAATAGVLAAAAAAAVVFAPAQPAHAWPLDNNVTVTGKVTGCSTGGPYNQATVRANLNGEIRTWTSGGWYSQPPTYALRFDNVPGGAGGWAWVVVHCTVDRPDYGVWIKVQRPVIGENWPGGNI
jgi:hypothetical protein